MRSVGLTCGLVALAGGTASAQILSSSFSEISSFGEISQEFVPETPSPVLTVGVSPTGDVVSTVTVVSDFLGEVGLGEELEGLSRSQDTIGPSALQVDAAFSLSQALTGEITGSVSTDSTFTTTAIGEPLSTTADGEAGSELLFTVDLFAANTVTLTFVSFGATFGGAEGTQGFEVGFREVGEDDFTLLFDSDTPGGVGLESFTLPAGSFEFLFATEIDLTQTTTVDATLASGGFTGLSFDLSLVAAVPSPGAAAIGLAGAVVASRRRRHG